MSTENRVETRIHLPDNTAPIYLFVIDMCITSQEMASLCQTLQLSLSLLPCDAMVGLISYGKAVYIHRLSAGLKYPTTHILAGFKGYTTQEIRRCIGGGPDGSVEPFLASPTDPVVMDVLINLRNETSLVRAIKKQVPLRSTGAALAVAAGLMECAPCIGYGCRIMLFTAGCCTQGPAMTKLFGHEASGFLVPIPSASIG